MNIRSRSRNQRLAAIVAVALAALLVVSGSVALAQEAEITQGPATPVAIGPATPPELEEASGNWPAPMNDLKAHRAAVDSEISSENVDELGVAWSFAIPPDETWGAVTAPPIVTSDTVYIQDMRSNVYALDRESGELLWEASYDVPTVGPNGVALGYGLIYATLGDEGAVVALDAATGEEVWVSDLTNNIGEGIDMSPLVYDNIVYVSTVPGSTQRFYRGGQKGIFYALEASTGHVLWQFDTTTDNLWGNARINSGGGLWEPPSIDDDGNIYFGVGNAAPWPGTPDWPDGSSRPGDNDYASSMVSLDAETGSVRWYYNAKPHDLFDLDFHLTPVLATVEIDGEEINVAVGGGKTGTVVAANADTGEILWDIEVGMHENDQVQELPEDELLKVLPGALGGVETPMAYADGVIFAPVVNAASVYNQTGMDPDAGLDIVGATGELVAINVADGSVKWQVDTPTMTIASATVSNDLVFTGGLDGVLRAYDVETGEAVWTGQLPAGLNAPPAIAGDTIFIGAGGALIPSADSTPIQGSTGLIALRLGSAEMMETFGTPVPEASPEAGGSPEAVEEDVSTDAGEAAVESVYIEMIDIAFVPTEETIAADTDVEFTFENTGVTMHDFTIDELDIDVEVDPGESVTIVINAPAGEYTFYCDVPGHRAAGMVGTLTVQ